jgi:hypothetical protein
LDKQTQIDRYGELNGDGRFASHVKINAVIAEAR